MKSLLGRFLRDSKGSVAIITGLAAIPMLMLVGMGIDYGIATDRQTQLNGYADAAALAAVTSTMMTQSASAATKAAQNMFNAQAAKVPSITYDPTKLVVSVQTLNSQRVASVTYAATYQTAFSTILGMTSMPLSGSSSATAGMPPNIDFYLLLDDSPLDGDCCDTAASTRWWPPLPRKAAVLLHATRRTPRPTISGTREARTTTRLPETLALPCAWTLCNRPLKT